MKPRKYSPISDIKFVNYFQYSKLFSLCVHWVFQNTLNMDKTELIFKLTIDLVLTFLFAALLQTYFSWFVSGLAGFLLAHTVNFIFNSQIYVVLKFFGTIKHERSQFEEYIQSIRERLNDEPSIRWAGIYGSMARGELKSTSDLDIRLIRFPGIYYGVRACWFILRERTRAHANQFPVDFLVFDSQDPLNKLRSDEVPIIIYRKER